MIIMICRCPFRICISYFARSKNRTQFLFRCVRIFIYCCQFIDCIWHCRNQLKFYVMHLLSGVEPLNGKLIRKTQLMNLIHNVHALTNMREPILNAKLFCMYFDFVAGFLWPCFCFCCRCLPGAKHLPDTPRVSHGHPLQAA